jgi:hypothetical protein
MDAFARYAVRIRAVLRADVQVFRPQHLAVLTDLQV